MTGNLLPTVILPAALSLLMLGLGMALTVADFSRLLKYPKDLLVALACQTVLLPFCAFLIAYAFALPPEIAVGLMLIAAAPGGSTANLYSHFFGGDVALNISLTAINSLLALFTLPLTVNIALYFFMGKNEDITLPFSKVIDIFILILGPAFIGMIIRRFWPAIAQYFAKPVRIGSIAVVVLLLAYIISTLANNKNAAGNLIQTGIAALLFNIVSMLCGYYLPQLFAIQKRQATAIAFEIGIHNTTLALFIAITILSRPNMAISPAIYGVIMFFTAGVFGYMVSRK